VLRIGTLERNVSKNHARMKKAYRPKPLGLKSHAVDLRRSVSHSPNSELPPPQTHDISTTAVYRSIPCCITSPTSPETSTLCPYWLPRAFGALRNEPKAITCPLGADNWTVLDTTVGGIAWRAQIKRSPTRRVGGLPDKFASGRSEGQLVQTNEIAQETDPRGVTTRD